MEEKKPTSPQTELTATLNTTISKRDAKEKAKNLKLEIENRLMEKTSVHSAFEFYRTTMQELGESKEGEAILSTKIWQRTVWKLAWRAAENQDKETLEALYGGIKDIPPHHKECADAFALIRKRAERTWDASDYQLIKQLLFVDPTTLRIQAAHALTALHEDAEKRGDDALPAEFSTFKTFDYLSITFTSRKTKLSPLELKQWYHVLFKIMAASFADLSPPINKNTFQLFYLDYFQKWYDKHSKDMPSLKEDRAAYIRYFQLQAEKENTKPHVVILSRIWELALKCKQKDKDPANYSVLEELYKKVILHNTLFSPELYQEIVMFIFNLEPLFNTSKTKILSDTFIQTAYSSLQDKSINTDIKLKTADLLITKSHDDKVRDIISKELTSPTLSDAEKANWYLLRSLTYQGGEGYLLAQLDYQTAESLNSAHQNGDLTNKVLNHIDTLRAPFLTDLYSFAIEVFGIKPAGTATKNKSLIIQFLRPFDLLASTIELLEKHQLKPKFTTNQVTIDLNAYLQLTPEQKTQISTVIRSAGEQQRENIKQLFNQLWGSEVKVSEITHTGAVNRIANRGDIQVTALSANKARNIANKLNSKTDRVPLVERQDKLLTIGFEQQGLLERRLQSLQKEMGAQPNKAEPNHPPVNVPSLTVSNALPKQTSLSSEEKEALAREEERLRKLKELEKEEKRAEWEKKAKKKNQHKKPSKSSAQEEVTDPAQTSAKKPAQQSNAAKEAYVDLLEKVKNSEQFKKDPKELYTPASVKEGKQEVTRKKDPQAKRQEELSKLLKLIPTYQERTDRQEECYQFKGIMLRLGVLWSDMMVARYLEEGKGLSQAKADSKKIRNVIKDIAVSAPLKLLRNFASDIIKHSSLEHAVMEGKYLANWLELPSFKAMENYLTTHPHAKRANARQECLQDLDMMGKAAKGLKPQDFVTYADRAYQALGAVVILRQHLRTMPKEEKSAAITLVEEAIRPLRNETMHTETKDHPHIPKLPKDYRLFHEDGTLNNVALHALCSHAELLKTQLKNAPLAEKIKLNEAKGGFGKQH